MCVYAYMQLAAEVETQLTLDFWSLSSPSQTVADERTTAPVFERASPATKNTSSTTSTPLATRDSYLLRL